MKEKEPRFEFAKDEDLGQKSEPFESSAEPDVEEYDDRPDAPTYQKSQQYRDEIRQQRAGKSVRKKFTAKQLQEEAERSAVPKRKWAQEGHRLTATFLKQLNEELGPKRFDEEYLRKSNDEKEAIFLNWLERRNSKTA
ncbi:MAG: hypothetical protein KW804_02620 [Candidatus Doudnabacteria bacterium]|nr:hypothetical protein [Candidatus Doudnabacteria bacterium]